MKRKRASGKNTGRDTKEGSIDRCGHIKNVCYEKFQSEFKERGEVYGGKLSYGTWTRVGSLD